MLGTLFRSRDFIKSETELVVIVTPYMVRPTARQSLARADDGLRSGLRSEGQFPRPPQPDLRQDRGAAARRAEGRLRVHRRIAGSLEEAMRSPIAPRAASGSRPVVAQLLTVSLLALALAGCKTLDDEPGAHVAGWTLIDATQRHPIMVSQQPSTMTLRVARGSQGLTPAQKGQIATFLERYRVADAGNSKLVIAVPSGSPNESAAVRAVGEIRQLITAVRLLGGQRCSSSPITTDATPARRSASPICATSPRHRVRTLDHQPGRGLPQPAPSELRLCAAAQPCCPGRQSRGPARAPHHGTGRRRSAVRWCSTSIARASRRGPRRARTSAIQVKTAN